MIPRRADMALPAPHVETGRYNPRVDWTSDALRRGAVSLTLAVLLLSLVAGCESVPGLPPNPFRTTPTRVADIPPTPTPVVVEPTATPEPFRPYWVKNHRQTEMWSGQLGQTGVVSFGVTSDQFCVFQVLAPQEGPRLFVVNPFGRGQFWIDGDAVGPVAEEPRRAPGPKPADENCAGVVYDE